MIAMPSVTVRKITGAITIRTRFTKVSPTGLIPLATPGANNPSTTPRLMATSTWTVRLRWREDMGRRVYRTCGGLVRGSGPPGRRPWYIPCATRPCLNRTCAHVELAQAVLPREHLRAKDRSERRAAAAARAGARGGVDHSRAR